MAQKLEWEHEDGVYYTELGDGKPDYNFDTVTRTYDEPIIVYLGQDEVDADNCWDIQSAKLVAQMHYDETLK